MKLENIQPVIIGPPNEPVLFCSLASVVVCRRRLSSSVTLSAGGQAGHRTHGRQRMGVRPPPGRAHRRSGCRHYTAGQYCYVSLGRHLVDVVWVTGLVTVTYNAALKRPSFQSSVYSDSGGSYPASLANDGNRNTRSVNCSISQHQNNPWWAVDLGGPTNVSRVDLVNSAEAYGGERT